MWGTACNMLCHAGVTATASPTGVAGCQEKRMFSSGMSPWTSSPCGCGTAISKPLPEESHGKKSRDQRAGLVLLGGRLWTCNVETLMLKGSFHVGLKSASSMLPFLLSRLLGFFICLLELIGFLWCRVIFCRIAALDRNQGFVFWTKLH